MLAHPPPPPLSITVLGFSPKSEGGTEHIFYFCHPQEKKELEDASTPGAQLKTTRWPVCCPRFVFVAFFLSSKVRKGLKAADEAKRLKLLAKGKQRKRQESPENARRGK